MKSNSLSAVLNRRDVARQTLIENRRRNAARNAAIKAGRQAKVETKRA